MDHESEHKCLIYVSEATGQENWTLFSHVLVMQWGLAMFGDFRIFVTGTEEVHFSIPFCPDQNKCVQILFRSMYGTVELLSSVATQLSLPSPASTN